MSFTSMEIGGVRYNGHMQAGIYSFLKTPIMENPTEEKLREAGVKAAIMGIPFDGGTMSRVGQSNGPRSIRESSQCFSPMHVDYNINFAENSDFTIAVTLIYALAMQRKHSGMAKM